MKKRGLGIGLVAAMMVSMISGGCANNDGAQQLYEAAAKEDGIAKPTYDSEKKTTLHVLNWGDFMDDNVIKAFEKEYPNITVEYETMASNEEMYIQLKSGSIYDICFPSDYIIQRLIREDLLHEMDHSRLPHMVNLDERFLDIEFDPGNRYSLPYMWGTLGILYNSNMVNEPITSWNSLWDAQYEQKIIMYDSVRDSFTPALSRLGYDINTKVDSEIQAAEQSLIDQKSLVLAYGLDDIRDKMIGEEAALSVVYSGDALAAMSENSDLAYVVPEEGSNIWYDNVVITKTSENVDAAYLFIDYLMRAEIAKVNTEFIGYSTPNKAAFALLDTEWQNDPVYQPTQAEIDRCEIHKDLEDYMAIYNDAWQRVKAS